MLLHNFPANPADIVKQSKGSFARLQLGFGLIFTLAASIFGFFGVVRPALQRRAAAQWTATPCVITQSSVVRHSSGSSTNRRRSTGSYVLSVAYNYKFQGQPFRGTRFSFDISQGADFQATSQVARQFPPGSATVCWVNPARPSEAVLRREAQQPRWLILVPLLLFAAGVGVSFNAWKTLTP